jgi:hypothetical protein
MQHVEAQPIEKRLKALFEIARSLSSSAKVEELLALILQKSQEVTNSEGASMLLRVPGTDLLEFVNVTGNASGYLREKRIAFGDGISGEVALSKNLLNIPDAYQDPRFNRSFDDASGFRTREVLAIPLLYSGQVVGVLSVINHKTQKPFGPDDEAILGLFCDQATVALIQAFDRKKSEQRSRALRVLTEETARILGNELTLLYAHLNKQRKHLEKGGDALAKAVTQTLEPMEKSADSLARIARTLSAHTSNLYPTGPDTFSFDDMARHFSKETRFHDVPVLKLIQTHHETFGTFAVPMESVFLSLESLIESLASRFPAQHLPPESVVVLLREREGFLDFCLAGSKVFTEPLEDELVASHNLLSLATVSALVDSMGGEFFTHNELKSAKVKMPDFAGSLVLSGHSSHTFWNDSEFPLLFQIILPLSATHAKEVS